MIFIVYFTMTDNIIMHKLGVVNAFVIIIRISTQNDYWFIIMAPISAENRSISFCNALMLNSRIDVTSVKQPYNLLIKGFVQIIIIFHPTQWQ